MKTEAKNAMVAFCGVLAVSVITYLADKLTEIIPHYDKQGFDQNGFDREGYNRRGFNSKGFDRNGYDAEGFDKDGYSSDGYSRSGLDRKGYDRNGFNLKGFNKFGFDADGFDKSGYSVDGYDREGRDRKGFDRNGFGRDGFNLYGYDAEGFSRKGYSVDGFDREGYDRQGFGRNYYNAAGIDRAGRDSMQYSGLMGRLYTRLLEAHNQMDLGAFRYALNDSRLVMEEAIRLVVEHAIGIDGSGDGLLDNLKICESKSLLPVDSLFIDRLHGVRLLCNSVTHELDASEQLTHQKTYFVVMQTRDLLKVAESTLYNT